MSATIKIADQQVTLGDFSGYKFLEATALLGEIVEAIPLADEQISAYTQRWLADNGSERILDRAAARYMLGTSIDPITDAEWDASDQKLTLSKSPDGNVAMMRAFPVVYKHARTQVERLLCLIATPNSKLEDHDAQGKSSDELYVAGGPVHEMRRLILHRAGVADQARLVLGSMRQLAEEMQAADLGEQMGEFRTAVKALADAIGDNAAAAKRDDEGPSDESESDTEPSVPVSEPSSSTLSSPATPA